MLTNREREQLEADLSAYLDGELDERRTAEIELALESSEQARQTLETLRLVSDRLGTLPRHRAPDQLTSAMASHAERRLLLGDDTTVRRSRIIRLVSQISAAAAVIAACAFVGWQVLQGPDTGQQPPMERSAPRALKNAPAKPMAIALAKDKKKGEMHESRRGRGEDAYYGGQPEVVDEIEAHSQERIPQSRVVELAELTDAARAGEASVARGGAAFARESVPETREVHIWITPRDEAEYVRMAAVLASWSAPAPGRRLDEEKSEFAFTPADQRELEGKLGAPLRRSKAMDTLGSKKRSPSVAHVYQISAAELPTRIHQLSRNIDAPNQIRVQMNFDPTAEMPAGDMDIPGDQSTAAGTRPARPAAPSGYVGPDRKVVANKSHWLFPGGRQRAKGDEDSAAAEQPRKRVTRAGDRGRNDQAGVGVRGQPSAARDADDAVVAPGPRREAASAPVRSSVRPAGGAKSHTEAPDGKPSTVPAAQAPAPDSTEETLDIEGQPKERLRGFVRTTTAPATTDRLFDRLFLLRRSGGARGATAAATMPATQPAADRLTFRVTILPPSAAPTTPAASQPADGPGTDTE